MAFRRTMNLSSIALPTGGLAWSRSQRRATYELTRPCPDGQDDRPRLGAPPWGEDLIFRTGATATIFAPAPKLRGAGMAPRMGEVTLIGLDELAGRELAGRDLAAVAVEGKRIAVANVGDAFYAFDDPVMEASST
jgi:hypothetical protein